jgi:hypothetical protein
MQTKMYDVATIPTVSSFAVDGCLPPLMDSRRNVAARDRRSRSGTILAMPTFLS